MSAELEQQVGCIETITEVFAICTLTINYRGRLEGRKPESDSQIYVHPDTGLYPVQQADCSAVRVTYYL